MTAITELQTKIGVTADGDMGPKTVKAIMNHFHLTRNKVAHFLGQTSHESGGFNVLSENLNYSPEGLNKTFKKYFPTIASTAGYARQPQKIANKVYANRNGNGSEASGDGWKFRGRGVIQLTGKANYQAFANYIKDQSVMSNPDLVATKYAFESAIFFFNNKGLWAIADRGVNDQIIYDVTKIVNGGTNGLDDREAKTKHYYNLAA